MHYRFSDQKCPSDILLNPILNRLGGDSPLPVEIPAMMDRLGLEELSNLANDVSLDVPATVIAVLQLVFDLHEEVTSTVGLLSDLFAPATLTQLGDISEISAQVEDEDTCDLDDMNAIVGLLAQTMNSFGESVEAVAYIVGTFL